MKNLLNVSLLILLLAGCLAAQKPDSSGKHEMMKDPPPEVKLPAAKEVVDKYVKAIGGKDALVKLRSRYQTGAIELSPMGLKGTVEIYARSDNRSLTKINLDGVGEILDAFDGTSAWTSNPMQGSRVKEGKELLQTKRMSSFGRETNFENYYSSMKIKGVEKVGDREAYVFVGSSDGLPDDVLYFDTETGLLLRSDSIVLSPEGQQATSTFYEDYREVNGVKSAFRIKAKTPAFEITTVLSEIKYDVPIADSIFVRPN